MNVSSPEFAKAVVAARLTRLGLIVSAITSAAPATAQTERESFADCLEQYAQTAFLSPKTAAGIAADALRSCALEREKFHAALARKRFKATPSTGSSSLSDEFQRQDRSMVQRVILLVNRFR